jgi:4-hydroxybenzoyl-CoA thioesterase
MSKTHRLPVQIEFGDCDPAQIVYFPNFFRWIDASSRHYFTQCGVPPWRELEPASGIIGTPLVSTQARFLKPATYGEKIEVETTIAEWRGKSFLMKHRILRGADVLCECEEVRVFARRVGGDITRIEAVPAPDDIRAACEG